MRLAHGFQTNRDFISLKAWFWVKRNLKYAVAATAALQANHRRDVACNGATTAAFAKIPMLGIGAYAESYA